MTAEETKQFNTLKDTVAGLQDQINALKNNATIPFDIGEAMKARILQDAGVLATSSKTPSSEDVAVLVSTGPNVYSDVLGSPDGFLAVTITGNTIYIPSYN